MQGNEGGAPPPRRMGLNDPKSETATTATAIAVASSAEEGRREVEVRREVETRTGVAGSACKSSPFSKTRAFELL